MARWMNPTRKDVLEVNQKLKDRPRNVRAIAKKLDFFSLYWLQPVQSHVIIYSVEDDGSITVSATREYNHLVYDVLIFGVDLEDLHTCEIPSRAREQGADGTSRTWH